MGVGRQARPHGPNTTSTLPSAIGPSTAAYSYSVAVATPSSVGGWLLDHSITPTAKNEVHDA
eukprot:scaffold226639_cov43-Tisochrysis_lutea.AAC.3